MDTYLEREGKIMGPIFAQYENPYHKVRKNECTYYRILVKYEPILDVLFSPGVNKSQIGPS